MTERVDGEELKALIRKAIDERANDLQREVMTIDAACEFVGVSRKTFFDNGWPMHKISQREYRCLRSELIEFVKSKGAA